MRLRVADRITATELERLQLAARLAADLSFEVWLVGGPVRDILLARPSLDLDLTVEGEALPLARALAQATGGELTVHERFGTACVAAGEFHFDVATARRESYPQPGALPLVEPADLREDLRRRDFTINAIALRLDAELETLYDPFGGYADLRRGLLRGLHPATFHDDPTRLIRLARYAARYGCRVEAETSRWVWAAVESKALDTLTGPRVWLELRRLLREATAPEACALLHRYGVLEALGLAAEPLPALRDLYVASHLLAALAGPEDRVAAALGLLAGPEAAVRTEAWGLTAGQRKGAIAASRVVAQTPAAVFAAGAKNSTLYEGFGPLPPAALLALWAGRPEARAALERYLPLAAMRSDITGEALQEAGYCPSPAFGPALRAALHAVLDYHADREEQLRAALRALSACQQAPER